MKRILLLSTVLLGCACSNEDIYTALQHNARENCKHASGLAYEECLLRASQSYQDYEQTRTQQSPSQ